jgi:probable F420-dependent oxidoreductase
MKFGIPFCNVGPYSDPALALRFAKAAEDAGFESLWTVEHVVVPHDYKSQYPYDPSGKMPGTEDNPIPDPLIWLSYVAGVTSRIRLATGILILPQRNPVVLAKELATLDQLSGGRMDLGIGVGWLEEEFDAIGVPFGTRGKRTDDYVAAMRALWTEDMASHHSEFIDFTDCVLRPRPAQGTIPIHVGGHSDAAARRAGRLGDGFFPGRGGIDELKALRQTVIEAADAAGRDGAAVEISAGGAPTPEAIEELAGAGVDRLMVPSFLFWGGDPETTLGQFGENVIAKFS